MPIRNRLSEMLGRKRLKMSDVVRGTGLSRAAVENVYHERAGGIDYRVLERLCKYLDCQPGDLLVYTESEDEVK